MTEHVDTLRILAKDGGKLTPADQAMLAFAADLLEQTQATAEQALSLNHVLVNRCNALQDRVADREKFYRQQYSMGATFSWVWKEFSNAR